MAPPRGLVDDAPFGAPATRTIGPQAMERLGAGRTTSLSLDVPLLPVDVPTTPSTADDPAPTADDAAPTADAARSADGTAPTADVTAIPDDRRAGSDEWTLPGWVRNGGWSLLGLQLVVMVVFSTVQYDRFAETTDFANYSQAWWAIAHGNLDPFSSGLGVAFWKNNAEFILWPLSLLYYVDPHPVVLLWVQDVAVVLTEVVAFGWIRKVVERRSGRIPPTAATLLVLGSAVVLVANPWAFETIAFDFHVEPLTTLFIVLVGYDLWAGRTRRLWLWVSLAVVSSGLAAFYLVGVGLSGVLAGRETRRRGAVVGAVGLAWFVVLSAVGGIGVGGTTFRSSYGYLVGSRPGRIGPLDVVVGVFGHPGAVVHMAASHWFVVASFLVVVGAVGVLSSWGFGMALVVLVPNVLDSSGHFIRYAASFQSWPALPFILVGSVMVLVRLLEGSTLTRRVAVDIGVAWAVLLLTFATLGLPSVPRAWLAVDPPAASVLARVDTVIPAGAEVIASQGVMGRFALRDSAYPLQYADQRFPVDRRLVVFVLAPKQGIDDALPHQGEVAAVSFVRNRLHARVLAQRSGVDAFAWAVPAGTRRVTLP